MVFYLYVVIVVNDIIKKSINDIILYSYVFYDSKIIKFCKARKALNKKIFGNTEYLSDFRKIKNQNSNVMCY